MQDLKRSKTKDLKARTFCTANNVEHNEKSTIFVTTVDGFQAVREDVVWTLAEIASNTRPIILSWSLQAVIKNHLLFPVLLSIVLHIQLPDNDQ